MVLGSQNRGVLSQAVIAAPCWRGPGLRPRDLDGTFSDVLIYRQSFAYTTTPGSPGVEA
jgi:hypothetical protein